jgi:hypothetical protein
MDTYDPLSNHRVFYDTKYVMPAEVLKFAVERWPVPKIENLRHMLRSDRIVWLGIMLNIRCRSVQWGCVGSAWTGMSL